MPKKKFKILETIRQGKVGGGESHVLELCTYLDKAVFEPVVLSFTEGPMVDELNRRGIRTHVINTEQGFDISIWKKVKAFMRAEAFDLVHAHGTRANSNVFWSAKSLKIPIVYTVHGWSFHLDQGFLKRKIRELSERFLCSQVDRTICVSRSNQLDGIKRVGLKHSKSSMIYNSINLEKFSNTHTFLDVREQLSIPKDKIVVGFIVRMTVQKDPITMVKAMKFVADENPNVHLLMVGDGPLKSDALQLIQTYGLHDHVTVEDFRTDVPNVLNAIDIYCLPSLWEGFPIGILEALSMEKAVIASPVDGTREMLKHEVSGLLVEFGNPRKLADAILRLATDEDFRKRLAKTGHDHVHENFGMERLARHVELVYKKFLPKL